MGGENLKLRRQKLNEQVLERLLDWIMDGTLSMGDHLNAEKIAQQLGVSRMPVREAFTMLEQLGLAEAVPYVGFKVIELDKQDVAEMAAVAAQNIDEAGIAELKNVHQSIIDEFAKREPDPRALYRLNKEFHFTLYQYAKLDRLYDIIHTLWNALSFYKLVYSKQYIASKEAADDMVETHAAVLKMLDARDPMKIKEILKTDLEYHTKDVPEAVSAIVHAKEH